MTGLRHRPWKGNARTLELTERIQEMYNRGRAGIDEPFVGITTDGVVRPGLFSVNATGVPADAMRVAATAFLDSLSTEERATATLGIEDEGWRSWMNPHNFLFRHGLCFDDMASAQREAAFGLIAASTSESAFATARGVMQLNQYIGDVSGSNLEFNEWYYWLSIFGDPSANEPWGWQIDGHHLIINCFVLGDQIVMTPTFMGSEPVSGEGPKYRGIRLFADEESHALALMQGFDESQRAKTVIGEELPHDMFTGAFRDNVVLENAGINHGDLDEAQRGSLRDLIAIYVGRLPSGHRDKKMEEVDRYLEETCFAWIGGCGDDSPFYYRIYNPVILIEFDHQRGVVFDNPEPTKTHLHTLVRTPNGNDYGKDLLRQHYEQHDRPGLPHQH